MKYRQRVLIFLFFVSIITYLDRVCIGIAAKAIRTDLGIPLERWGWVLSAFTLSYALFEIPTGAMGDRLGARSVLTRIVVWWSIFTALTGAASGLWMLIVIRFLFGIGEAGAYPNAALVVSRWFPLKERARAQSVVWMASRVGGALAPWLVKPIQENYSWRVSFYAFGLIGLVWAGLWYWWYRDRPSDKAGITAAEVAEIGESEHTAHHGLPWGIALRSWNFWKILLMYHTYCWGGFFYLTWLPTYLEEGRGFTKTQLSIYQSLPFIAGACGNLIGGTLSDWLTQRYGLKIGRRGVGFTGLALSALLMLLAALTPSSIAAAVFLTLGYGAMDCMLPASWAVCMDVGKKYAGTVSGTMNMAGQVGSFATSLIFGYLVTYFGNYNAPLFPMAALLFVAALFFLRIDPTEPLIPETSATTLSQSSIEASA